MHHESRARWALKIGKWTNKKMKETDPDLFSQHRHNDRVGVYSTYVNRLLRRYMLPTTLTISQLLAQGIWRGDG